MIRIICADDHVLIRKGLKRIVEKTPDMKVVDEVDDGSELLKKVREKKYDVVLLDITMPGADVFSVLKEIKSVDPDLPILILTMHPEEKFAIRTLRAGAAGYLTKNGAMKELVTAIRKVRSGKRYISETLAEKMVEYLDDDREVPPHEKLSDREFQVMIMLSGGETVKDIADNLRLSPKTVSTYRTRILEKMNMKKNAELTYYAIENRLI